MVLLTLEQKTEVGTCLSQATRILKANISDELLDIIKLIMWKTHKFIWFSVRSSASTQVLDGSSSQQS